MPRLPIAFMLLMLCATSARAELPIVFHDLFDKGAEQWSPMDPDHWKVVEKGGRTVFSHFEKQGKYKPPHRSPVNIAVRKGGDVTDFQLTAKVLSTHKDYGHRDACLVFGYQDPAHFYYVHFGKKTDDHANQIFIVDNAARIKISTKTTPGTPWDDQWHTLRVTRDVTSGAIEVFFDDLESPVMTANNKRFLHGRVGMGSFDDTTDWDSIELRGHVQQSER
ncbi:MAG: hypothetical protein KDB14_12215 [Planctomycetales bacterium]|nr:hypothetical protein [Planctomycetales bacterium]